MLTTNRTDPATFEWHADNKQDKLECGKILDWMWECHRTSQSRMNFCLHGDAPAAALEIVR